MSKYSYKARNNEGQSVAGVLEATSEQEAISQLGKMQYTPIAITLSQEAAGKDTPNSFWNFSLGSGEQKVKVKDVMSFCSNLSSMTSAGVPLLGAINTIAEQFQNPTTTKTLRKVGQLVSQGSSFSEALAIFPKVFSPFFVSMVKVGEMSGTLEETLNALSVYLEKQERLKQTVRGILIYPSILLIVGTAVVVLILVFLMPKFVDIFTKSGVTLPVPTKILYALSLFLKKYWLGVIVGIIAFVVGIKVSFMKEKTKAMWDRLFIKLPIIGSLLIKIQVARFCRTLGIMVNSGVSILVALNMVKQVLSNVVFVEILKEVYDSVERGEGIHKPLIPRKEFPKDVTYMISVGEQSGNIGQMLNKVADFYESKVEFEVKDLVALIEPIFICILGAVVGVIMASMILPMFDMIKTIEMKRQ